jgi:hypothetical protein
MNLRKYAAIAFVALLPVAAAADRCALTVEGAGSMAALRIAPSFGTGAGVVGTVGGAELRARYAVTNRLELQVGGLWHRSAEFVNTDVRALTPAGSVTGTLRQDVGRIGALAGVRYIAIGRVIRIPLGVDVGWVRTSVSRQDLLDQSDPGRPVSFGVRIDSTRDDRLVVAPSAGVEWLVTDRFSISVVPRAELPVASSSFAAITIPVAVGWSWYLL